MHGPGQLPIGSGFNFSFRAFSPESSGPNAIPEPIAYPSIDVTEFIVNTCHSEVVHPASLYFIQLVDTFINAHGSGFVRVGFELLFQLIPAFW